MNMIYFADLPVYRLSEEKYFRQRSEYISAKMAELETMGIFQPNRRLYAEDILRKEYGGGWRFNEITSFIRLYILGTQIRGELWKNDVKRIVKTRRKAFVEVQGKVVTEQELPIKKGNAAISAAIEKFIDRWEKEMAPQIVDRSVLAPTLHHIDWKTILFG